jgi:hypothetical protein
VSDHRTSQASTLPEWEVSKISTHSIGIKCPYGDCGNKAVVHGRKWLRGRKGHENKKTRACTFCFRAAWLPGHKPDN